MNKQKLKGLWIPAEILLNEELTDKEKLILAMILYLSEETSSCFASNKYIANIVNVTADRVSKIISSLRDKNYIKVKLKYKTDSKEIEERQFKNKKIYVYVIYILLIGIILYLVGNLLSSTLRNLCYIFNISEVVIGVALGVATSTPEFITFIESQRFHKNANKELGIIEASNNLLVSNTLNLFIIQSLSIVIIYFLE